MYFLEIFRVVVQSVMPSLPVHYNGAVNERGLFHDDFVHLRRRASREVRLHRADRRLLESPVRTSQCPAVDQFLESDLARVANLPVDHVVVHKGLPHYVWKTVGVFSDRVRQLADIHSSQIFRVQCSGVHQHRRRIMVRIFKLRGAVLRFPHPERAVAF